MSKKRMNLRKMRGGKNPDDFFSVFAIKLQDGNKYSKGVDFGILFYNFFSKQFQLFIYPPELQFQKESDAKFEEKYYGVFARELINCLCGLKLDYNFYGNELGYYTYVNEILLWRNLFKFHFIFRGNKLYSVRNNPDNSTGRTKVINALFESKLPPPEYEKREVDVKPSTEGTRWEQKNKDTHTFFIDKDNRNHIDFNQLSFTLSKVVDDEVAKKDYQPISGLFNSLKTEVISAWSMAKAAKEAPQRMRQDHLAAAAPEAAAPPAPEAAVPPAAAAAAVPPAAAAAGLK